VRDSPIERFLDDLFIHLKTAPARDARALLAESEAHLRDLEAEARSAGMSEHDAEIQAVLRFGDARRLADEDANRHGTGLAIRTVVSAWALGALGAIAVGVSGVVAGVMRLAGASDAFIARGPSSGGLSPAACARWLAGYPHASSCAQAATADWAAEVVAYRVVLGFLGLLAFGGLLLVRRRWPQLRGAWLPPVVIDTIATLAFAASGIWLAGLGADALLVASGRGAGQWLSAAPVALAAAAFFGLRLVEQLRAPSPA
jgi:MYXO-CTERM domain-containing protein